MTRPIFKIIIMLLFLPFLGGWFYPDSVEGIMKEFGFKLVSKKELTIPRSDNKATKYLFKHRLHKNVVITDYTNGFVEIGASYGPYKDPRIEARVRVDKIVDRGSLRNEIYKTFVTGEY
jgi:hypothetical protein